jgi:membrane glycosyltransferase
LGVSLALLQRRKQFGGALALIVSALLETLFAILSAPLMMLFHATFVLSIMVGSKSKWNAQVREGRMVAWLEALRRSGLHTLLAIVWGVTTWIYAPLFFWWLTPVLSGLILAPALIHYSSSLRLGCLMKRLRLLCIPLELHETREIRALQLALEKSGDAQAEVSGPLAPRLPPALPPVCWHPMPVNTL